MASTTDTRQTRFSITEDDPVMAFGGDQIHHQVWALNEDEVLVDDRRADKRKHTYLEGPAIVTVRTFNGTRIRHRWVRDHNTEPENVWDWIQRLICELDADELEPMSRKEWLE